MPFQLRLMQSEAFIRCAFGAYRSGKTTAAALCVFVNALRNPWRKEYGIGRPTTLITGLTSKVLRDSSQQALEKLIPEPLIARRADYRGEWDLVNGHRFLFYSLDRNATLEGVTACGILVDEAHKINAESWPNLQTRCSDPLAVTKLIMVSGLPVAGWLQTTFDRPEHRTNPQRHVEFVAMRDNTYLDPTVIAELENSIGAEEAAAKILGRWLSVEGAIYKAYDERIHVLDDPGDRSQWVDLSFDVGERAALVFLQHRPKKRRVIGEGLAVEGPDGLRLHVVEELIPPDGSSSHDAATLAKGRGWKVEPQKSLIFVDPKTSIDQIRAIEKVFPGVSVVKKPNGAYGHLIEEGIEAVRCALRSASGLVSLTFSNKLPRGKRSVLTAMANYRYKEDAEHVFKDHVVDHAADTVRMAVVHRLPVRPQEVRVRAPA